MGQMTEYELGAVGKAVDHVLDTAAPGLAWPTKQAIRNNILLRLRHQFNVPAPKRRDRTDPEGGIPGRQL